MSMLAERRRKTKWTLNPTGKAWREDKNKFGQRMLEKMGWKEGCGLGPQLQGDKDIIRVSAKNDKKGMGCKSSDDAWFKVQDEYEKHLSDMCLAYGKQPDSSPPRERKSLEEISRSSRARIHYAKFIRGKDISRYSEKDLACIFGKRITEPKTIPSNTVRATETHPTSTSEYCEELETTIETVENLKPWRIQVNNIDLIGDGGEGLKLKDNANLISEIGVCSSELSFVDASDTNHQEAHDLSRGVIGSLHDASNQHVTFGMETSSQKINILADNQQGNGLYSTQKSASDIVCCRCGCKYDQASNTGLIEDIGECLKLKNKVKDNINFISEIGNQLENEDQNLDEFGNDSGPGSSQKKKKKKKNNENKILHDNSQDDDDEECITESPSESCSESIGHIREKRKGIECIESTFCETQEKQKKSRKYEKTIETFSGDISEDPSKSSSLTEPEQLSSGNARKSIRKKKPRPEIHDNVNDSEVIDSGNQIENEDQNCAQPKNIDEFGNDSVPGSSQKKKESENRDTEDSLYETLQDSPLFPSIGLPYIDLDAFKGSNWANIKGYGY